jgi:hypothetical protein
MSDWGKYIIIDKEAEIISKASPASKGEYLKRMTKYEKFKSMTLREMALFFYNHVTSDVCKYCPHDRDYPCNGIPCEGKLDLEIIIEWLESEVEE